MEEVEVSFEKITRMGKWHFSKFLKQCITQLEDVELVDYNKHYITHKDLYCHVFPFSDGCDVFTIRYIDNWLFNFLNISTLNVSLNEESPIPLISLTLMHMLNNLKKKWIKEHEGKAGEILKENFEMKTVTVNIKL